MAIEMMTLSGFEELIPCDVAHVILGDYLSYHHQYKRINKRARYRFEQKDWVGIQKDANVRIEQYLQSISQTTEKVQELLGDKIHDRQTWKEIRHLFFEEIITFNTRNIAETYFNSVFRHCNRDGVDLDEDLMFISPTISYGEFRSVIPIFHSLRLVKPLAHVIEQMFHLYDLNAPFENLPRDIGYIVDVLEDHLFREHDHQHIKLELAKSLFYRNKCAYIVGRIVIDYKVSPFIIPLLHEQNGIYADAVLLDPKDAASIFSYSRSYFLTDTDMALDMVEFLHSILPQKALSELYNSLGFVKHAKTEFYREFERHMENTQDDFVIAPGIKGMVMTVFTLSSYNMVFKVIKDRFDPPKKVTTKIVKEKYDIVSRHDRVGRLVDSHEFRNLHFDLDRFSPELLEELKRTIPSKLSIEGNRLTISHLYIEKKLIPLDIYLNKVEVNAQKHIMQDYAQAIKELARVNIFPGDLLLKNFGVNRRKRVVFYDYDEIEFVSDLAFKKLPTARHEDDDWMSESWFTPNLNDIFPEQFPQFIVGDITLQDFMRERHNDIFEASFWTGVQAKLEQGEIISVFPYDENLRFKKLPRITQNKQKKTAA